jgi:DNA invertase Pin-like site-specific DNA recombinase
MGHLLGYARVSTDDQQPHLQVDALKQAGRLLRVVAETASGGRGDRRPPLDQVLDQLRPATPWSSGSWTGWAGLERQHR